MFVAVIIAILYMWFDSFRAFMSAHKALSPLAVSDLVRRKFRT